MNAPFRIIDISQPVSSTSACFPGDVPFTKDVTLTHADSGILNLTAFKMSPHVGTHADSPLHIGGDMDTPIPPWQAIGGMELSSFIGPVTVLELSPWNQLIEPTHIQGQLDHWASTGQEFPKRILFKTARHIRYDVFEDQYAAFSPAVAELLGSHGVMLMGIDTPSVDPVDSKTLETHHVLLKHRMSWLENLDLTQAAPGNYFLVALPLKMMELEASPVRAVLLSGLTEIPS